MANNTLSIRVSKEMIAKLHTALCREGYYPTSKADTIKEAANRWLGLSGHTNTLPQEGSLEFAQPRNDQRFVPSGPAWLSEFDPDEQQIALRIHTIISEGHLSVEDNLNSDDPIVQTITKKLLEKGVISN